MLPPVILPAASLGEHPSRHVSVADYEYFKPILCFKLPFARGLMKAVP